MKCPHCEKEIPGFPCPKCGETVFEAANYCMACGAPLKGDLQDTPPPGDGLEDDSDFDVENRVLCPDGTCTGIVVDGRCTECGRVVGDDGTIIEPEAAQTEEGNPSDEEKQEKKG